MAKDKRFWAHVAAGTVATIAVICGVWQCSDKDEARSEASEWRAAFQDTKEALDDAGVVIANANGKIRELRDSVAVCKKLIAQKDSTIVVLRDSLDVCRDAKACGCKPSAKTVDCGCNTKPAVKKPAAKPVATKPAPVKAAEPCEPKPVVKVVSGEDKVVVYDDAKKPDQAVIVNGDNSGTIIVNANGIVKDVNTPTVAAERRKQMMQGCTTTTTIVLGTRSKCR